MRQATRFFALTSLFAACCGCNAELIWEVDGSSVTPFATAGAGGGGLSISNLIQTLVLGQVDFSSLKPARRGMNFANGVATDGVRFAVADTNNHRVLIWNAIPTSSNVLADVVLGQSSFSGTTAATSASRLNQPVSVAFVNGKLMVADKGNNRVLIWNVVPTANGTPADVVVGQGTMSSAMAATSASGLSAPSDVASDGTRLIISDTGNHRALIWSSIPVTNGLGADVVIGQVTMTGSLPNHGVGADALGLNGPVALAINGTQLAIADKSNNRVLIFLTIPSANYSAADLVLGQGTFFSNLVSTNSTGLNNPSGVAWGSDGKFYVSDTTNSRVVFFNSTPGSSGAAFSGVLGQASFGTAASGSAASQLWSPHRLAPGPGGALYLADAGNHRVVGWSSVPTSSMASPASWVQGQPNFGYNLLNNPGIQNGSILNFPQHVVYDGTHLIVADGGNNRVLIWNSLPVASDATPDLVLGQPNMLNVSTSSGSAGMFGAYGVASDGARLVVADSYNHRVLIWNTFPTANGTPADIVLGQLGFGVGLANRGTAAGADTFHTPLGVAIIDGKIWVADSLNHRVLMWNTFPVVNGAPADFVLGQPNFTNVSSSVGNNGMGNPSAICKSGSGVFVVDQNNHRVLGWSLAPTTNGAPADLVLGQVNFAGNGPGTGSSGMNLPTHCQIQGGRMFVSDFSNNRILIWDQVPNVTSTPASSVFGQMSFGVVAANGGGGTSLSQATFNGPVSVAFSSGQIFIADRLNHRVQMLPTP